MNKQQEAITKMLLSDIMNPSMDKGASIERYARFMQALQTEQNLVHFHPVFCGVQGISITRREDSDHLPRTYL